MTRRARGEGTVYRSPDGGWRGSVLLDGRRLYVRATTKTAARKKLDEIIAAHRQGATRVTPSTTVAEWMRVYLTSAELRVGQSLKRRTVDGYGDAARRYINPLLGPVRLLSLTPEQVEQWHRDLQAKGLSAGTVRVAHRVLRSGLQVAVQRGYLPRNVAGLVHAPGYRTVMDALTRVQVEKLIAAARRTERLDMGPLRVMLGALCGLRQGEVLALQVSDLDLDRGIINVAATLARPSYRHGVGCSRQGHQAARCPTRQAGPVTTTPKSTAGRRQVPIPGPVLPVLRAHVQALREARIRVGSQWLTPGDEWLFAGPCGERPDIRGDARRWRDLVIATLGADAPTGTHAARRHAATAYAEGGAPLAETLRVFGWSKADLATIYYARLTPDFGASVSERVWGSWGEVVG